ncbi:hypothetical protein [Actinomadura napierensis]|uniref:Secreted protein n=1 Tax=Actinomadura napierensis TaxID=267854 RepID=A0ABP5JUF9_9ACTN
MRTTAKRLLVAAAAATALAALPLSAAHAAADPSPRGGSDHWHDWRFVGDYDSSLICEAQGTELVFSGGASGYRCESRGDSYGLYVR